MTTRLLGPRRRWQYYLAKHRRLADAALALPIGSPARTAAIDLLRQHEAKYEAYLLAQHGPKHDTFATAEQDAATQAAEIDEPHPLGAIMGEEYE